VFILERISITQDTHLRYFEIPPFHPSIHYPEYPWKDISAQPNGVYEAVRNNLIHLRLDQENINTPQWNPFKSFVTPGDSVLIKPNFVIHFNGSGEGLSCVVTHPSVIRPVLDFVAIAMKNHGNIIVGDAPIQSCRVEEILSWNGLPNVIDYFHENCDIQIAFRDLRDDVIRLENHSIISSRRKNPVKITDVKLGADSKLESIIQDAHLFCVDGYDQRSTAQSHEPGSHIYDIHSLAYEVDAIISIPKLKTHKKAGITGAIKNCVGLNANKNRLPHFRSGSPSSGGDEYPLTNIFRELYRILTQTLSKTDNKTIRYFIVGILYLLRGVFELMRFELIEAGAWPGNDTIWRMITDLNKVIYFSDAQGKMHPEVQRKIFHLVDGIVAGENMGPLRPSPRHCGVIISGFNPFLIDAAACELMGFDYRKIKSVAGMQDLFLVEPAEAEIFMNGKAAPFSSLRRQIKPPFIPPHGWEEIIAP
jgi:uncharacterized protein (DUF362 family)